MPCLALFLPVSARLISCLLIMLLASECLAASGPRKVTFSGKYLGPDLYYEDPDGSWQAVIWDQMEVDLTVEVLGAYTQSGSVIFAQNATVTGDIHLWGTAADYFSGQTTIAESELDLNVTLARGPSEFYLEADSATGQVKSLWVLLATNGSANHATAIAIDWLPANDGSDNFFLRIKLPIRNFDWVFDTDGRQWYELTGKVTASTFDISPYRIGPNERWVKSSTDPNALGLWRTQYLPDQTFRPGFSIIASEDTTVKVVIELSRIQAYPSTGKFRWPIAKTEEFSPLVLQEGVSRRIYFPIMADDDLVPGYYELRAYLESVANPGMILDTTAPGTMQVMPGFEDAWIEVPIPSDGRLPYPLHQGIQKCREHPVILLHGFTGHTSDFGELEPILTREENFAVRSFDYSLLTDAVSEEATIRNIAAVLKGIPSRTFTTAGGVPKLGSEVNYENSVAWTKEYFQVSFLDLVVHSMGGLVSGAYVAGQAVTGLNNSTPHPYQNDIDRIVTLATPFYGPVDQLGGFFPIDPTFGKAVPAVVGFLRLKGLPIVQIEDMLLGSDAMWLLHKNITFSNYLNIGGVLDAQVPANDSQNDEIVPLPSSLAYTISGEKRFFLECKHTPGNNKLPVANVTYLSSASHGPFQWLESFLKREAARPTMGFPAAGNTAFSSYPHIVKVTNAAGDRVRADVAARSSYFPYRYWRNASGLYSRTRVPFADFVGSAVNKLRVYPTGTDAGQYFGVTLDLTSALAGRLKTTEVVLAPARDTDGDFLPDNFEEEYSGGSATALSPMADDDGDRLTNLWELYLGTDPTSNQSSVRLSETSIDSASASPSPPGATTRRFNFVADTVPGVLYQIQTAPTPGGPWTNVGAPIEGVGFPVKFAADIPTGATNLFYHLEMSLAP